EVLDGHVALEHAGTDLELHERSLSEMAERHDTAGIGHFRALGLELFLRFLAPLRTDLRHGVLGMKAVPVRLDAFAAIGGLVRTAGFFFVGKIELAHRGKSITERSAKVY